MPSLAGGGNGRYPGGFGSLGSTSIFVIMWRCEEMEIEIIPNGRPKARGDVTLYEYICHDYEDTDIFINVYVAADLTRILVSDTDREKKSPDISTPPGVGPRSTSEEILGAFEPVMADLVRKWIQAVRDGDMIETEEMAGWLRRWPNK